MISTISAKRSGAPSPLLCASFVNTSDDAQDEEDLAAKMLYHDPSRQNVLRFPDLADFVLPPRFSDDDRQAANRRRRDFTDAVACYVRLELLEARDQRERTRLWINARIPSLLQQLVPIQQQKHSAPSAGAAATAGRRGHAGAGPIGPGLPSQPGCLHGVPGL